MSRRKELGNGVWGGSGSAPRGDTIESGLGGSWREGAIMATYDVTRTGLCNQAAVDTDSHEPWDRGGVAGRS